MAEKTEAKKEKKKEESADIGSAPEAKKSKELWTVERAHRAAKRFTTREEWRTGAPSSYKAAAAKGWMDQCCGHMKGEATSGKSTRRSA